MVGVDLIPKLNGLFSEFNRFFFLPIGCKKLPKDIY